MYFNENLFENFPDVKIKFATSICFASSQIIFIGMCVICEKFTIILLITERALLMKYLLK